MVAACRGRSGDTAGNTEAPWREGVIQEEKKKNNQQGEEKRGKAGNG